MPGAPANRRGAVGELVGVDVDAERLGKQILHQREERAVPAAVVEQPPARKRRDQLAGETEPAAVAPAHEAARTEQLLLRVVAGWDIAHGSAVQGSRFTRFRFERLAASAELRT